MCGKKLLEIINVSKSFSTVRAFSRVSFDLYESEIHCIVGENGAGKSTFIKILSGALLPDEGELVIDGIHYSHLTPHLAQELGIQTIYQETTLVPGLSVMENVFLGNEKTTGKVFTDFKAMRRETLSLLQFVGIDIKPEERVENLGIAERQAVQIAKALARKARILIMDEPTASFGKGEIDRLLGMVRQIRASGVGIIYISHHLDEIFDIADRVTVLKDGIKVGCHAIHEVDYRQLIQEMVGRDAAQFYHKTSVPIGSVVLSINNAGRDSSHRGISFELRRGEILGMAGMVGSGRTELVRMLFGADRMDHGEIILKGKKILIRSPRDAIRHGICLIPEDRQKSGLILKSSIKDNILLPSLRKVKGLFLKPSGERKLAEGLADSLRIKASDVFQLVQNLSGGNQQKVVLAKWLLSDAEIFIFDEPTRGIDIGAKEEIYTIMTHLVEQGKSIIMVSSDMPELIAISDRILVLRKGEAAATLKKEDISEENILTCSIGG